MKDNNSNRNPEQQHNHHQLLYQEQQSTVCGRVGYHFPYYSHFLYVFWKNLENIYKNNLKNRFTAYGVHCTKK